MSRQRAAVRARTVVGDVGLWAAVLVLVGIPVLFVLFTASKTGDDAKRISLSLPTAFALFENLRTVIVEGEALQGFVNSCLITIPTIALTLLLGSMAAWVFARTKSRGVQALYYLAIAGVLLPPAIITTIRVLQSSGLYGTQIGLILFYSAVYLAVAIFLITGFVRSIPFSMEEAAALDGAGTLRIFFSIILPSLRPVLLTTGIFLALSIWNDFFYAFFLLPKADDATMPLGLYAFVNANQFELNWNLIFAQVLTTSLPLLIVYIFAQKRIISGLLGGGVK